MLKQIESGLVALNRWLLIVLLLGMASIVFVNVLLRYTTGDSLVWAEEVARHMMIWCTFLGAGLVLRFGGHVAIDALQKAVPHRLAVLLRYLVACWVGGFCALMCYVSVQYLTLMQYQTTPATGVSFAYVYAAIPVGFALTLVHLVFVLPGFLSAGTLVESDEMDAEAAASL